MGYTETRIFTPSHTNHAQVPTLDCPLTLSTPDGSDLIAFSGFVMTVTTVDPTLVGSPRVTQTRAITITKSGQGFEETLDISITVNVIPSCTLSELQ